MEHIPGALVSACIEALFEKLRSSELLNFGRQEKLISETEDWKTSLEVINDWLEDAEERQITERIEKKWLDDLRDLAYDIEDVLDEFNEALERQKTRRLSFITGLLPASVAFKREMKLKIKDITKRMQRLIPEQRPVNFKRIARETPNNPKERPPTTSLVESSDICGRNDDNKVLVDTLLKHEGGSNRISVIPIVGMGGIGKTTLAQLVYHDSDVKVSFNIRVWVYVSQKFDVVELTRTILRSIDPKIPGLQNLEFNLLQEKLKEKLSGKKFLLILDDLWEENDLRWGMLCSPFAEVAAGSKIVITTRKDVVAKMAAPDVQAHHVKELPDGECLSLLARHALGVQNFDSHSSLKDIALDMVKKCKGLPLAVKVLGGLLRPKGPSKWESVLKDKMWNLWEARADYLLPTLKLSYYDLPSHLKRCFVYCAIFPKGYIFKRDELVLLWMAEGFLHSPRVGKQMEDIGIDYFEDLVSRSLFQSSRRDPFQSSSRDPFQSSSEDPSVYVMHDLICDLARSIGGEIYYNYENNTSNLKFEKVRHGSFIFPEDKDFQGSAAFTPMTSLRTLLIDRRSDLARWFYNLPIKSKYLRVLSINYWGIESLPDSIEDLKLLRHLDLSNTGIERLPESISSLFDLHTLLLRGCAHLKKLPDRIGNLINLRHLDLSWTNIERLPESISSLFNLHTLLLCHCNRLETLPDRIGNLVNLRHLDISYTDKLQTIPSSISMLTNLQTLSKFVVSEGHGTTISVLKNFSHLCGILSIEGLHNVTNLQDAKSVNLKEKQGLKELVFKWDHHDGGNDLSILEALEPHQNLKRLTINSYGGSEFPLWVSDPSFSNLVSLILRDCGKIELLPALHNLSHDNQQSCLESLVICDCASVEYFATNFKLPASLTRLEISRCQNLLSLPDGLMTLDDNTNTCQSHVEHLMISQCQRLTSFPPGKLPATLKSLDITSRGQMTLEDIFSNNIALESISIEFNNNIRVFPSIDCFQSLRCLYIILWFALESFTEMGLCNLALRSLTIMNCPKLLSLPSQMDTLLPSLRFLTVADCPCLMSLAQEGGGLPKNLECLNIVTCKNLRQPIAEWGLHLLSSLEILVVKGICSAVVDVVSFPDDNYCLLPTSLRSLKIGDFMNLESLGLGLQKLTCLYDLWISNCPKLSYVPKEALPSSLREVRIWSCRLLEEHWLKNRGEYPPSISFQKGEMLTSMTVDKSHGV